MAIVFRRAGHRARYSDRDFEVGTVADPTTSGRKIFLQNTVLME